MPTEPKPEPKAAHTPGPYVFRNRKDIGPCVDTGNDYYVTSRAHEANDPEVVATLTLFAAAPEMVEALTLALPLVESIEDCDGVTRVVDAIRAALAKANGEKGGE